jgi:hypothetical protein
MAAATGEWGDRLNPLTVRVVRQQLRSWASVGVFLTLLLSGVLISLILVSLGTADANGRQLFLWLASGWSLIAWVILPTMLGTQLANERRDQAWELVELAGIDPWRLLAGWLAASAAQQALIASAMAPFLIMAWLLRGLDLLLIVLTLVAVPLVATALSALALQAATLARKDKSRAGIGPGLGGLLVWLVSLSLGWQAIWFQGDVWLLDQLRQGEPRIWAVLAFLVNLAVLAAANALVLAAARLRHQAENRATGPRLMAVVLVANAALWCMALPFIGGYGRDWRYALSALAVATLLRAVVLGIGAFADHWDLTPRQARAFTGPRWRRLAMQLVGPGSRAGRLLYLLLTALGVGVAILVLTVDPNRANQLAALVGLGIASYAAICLVLSDWLARALLSRRVHRPAAQVGVTWLMAMALCGGPLIGQLLLGESLLLTLCSPFTGVRLMADRDGEPWAKAIILAAGGVALVVTAVVCCRRAPTVRRLLPEDA